MDVQADLVRVINGRTVDLSKEAVLDAAGNVVPLRAQSFAVLRHLLENPDRLVTRNELMDAVWPHTAVTDDSLVQCIGEIRRALGAGAHEVLTTVPRRGYRLVLAAGRAASHDLGLGTGRRVRWLTLAAALMVVAALAAWWTLIRQPALADVPTIAVLPFDNLGSDKGQDYFADGITEDLITDLSKLSGVLVIARNSVWPYRGANQDIRKVAADLHVRYVLEGSVRREADELRINAQLIDATAGTHVWADRFDSATNDIFAVQDQVITKIVSALSVRLGAGETLGSNAAETTNMQAYDAVLKGLDYLHRDTEQETLAAIDEFKHALDLDPDYARAHAALAAAHWRVVQSFWFSSSGPAWVHAYEAYKKHLDLSLKRPTALAYITQSWQFQFEGRYDEAFAVIEKALALTPGDPDIHVAKARILNSSGHASEAEKEVRLAMRLDPGYAPATLRVLSVSLFHQKRYQEAADLIERIRAQGTIELEDYWTLAAVYGHLGRIEDAHKAIEDYNALAVPAFYDPLTVQEAEWFWGGDAFDYYPPYLEDVLVGLRKAGAPPGPGADLPLATYKSLMTRTMGTYAIKGATKVDPAGAKALFDRGVAFVDGRARLEYARSHVPGAFGLSLAEQLSREALLKVVKPEQEVVFYCHGKYCSVSAYASAKAIAWGWQHVYYFADGFPGWQDAGYPQEGEAVSGP